MGLAQKSEACSPFNAKFIHSEGSISRPREDFSPRRRSPSCHQGTRWKDRRGKPRGTSTSQEMVARLTAGLPRAGLSRAGLPRFGRGGEQGFVVLNEQLGEQVEGHQRAQRGRPLGRPDEVQAKDAGQAGAVHLVEKALPGHLQEVTRGRGQGPLAEPREGLYRDGASRGPRAGDRPATSSLAGARLPHPPEGGTGLHGGAQRTSVSSLNAPPGEPVNPPPTHQPAGATQQVQGWPCPVGFPSSLPRHASAAAPCKPRAAGSAASGATHLVQEACEEAEHGVVVLGQTLQDLAAAVHTQAALHVCNGT